MELTEYLANIPKSRKSRFESIRKRIKILYLKAKESMRYKMPTYEFAEGWVALANQKSYISLYTCSFAHIAEFKDKHGTIKTGRGCINFRDRDEIPLTDLDSVIQSAMEFRH
ncbi:MAG: DUF1801 domain-containing protein [Desulfobacterales bacterium]|nr:DUF1801 domain-containing protein [Deltaproteobacteria bacterium]MBT8359813.1 DUF1801 domain-containing protein [Deltaproteobacteria bacterium]NNK96020.1 DUF1801 domain-containing protein [Desulfobacterales bacterium]